jgi:hypothetical protein
MLKLGEAFVKKKEKKVGLEVDLTSNVQINCVWHHHHQIRKKIEKLIP